MDGVSERHLEVAKDGKQTRANRLVPGITPKNVLVGLGFEEGPYRGQPWNSEVRQHRWAIDSCELVVLYSTR